MLLHVRGEHVQDHEHYSLQVLSPARSTYDKRSGLSNYVLQVDSMVPHDIHLPFTHMPLCWLFGHVDVPTCVLSLQEHGCCLEC
jgi:hypothetical protein